ncbi:MULTISPECIES: branched-chain amino acid ABC transporter permease [Achromobacter]|jgi:branched-chain amino acid transport system permease protein|uniref:High-affinity branched-chain amino acid transport system permease protein LivH n=5 Tax=Achromobacter TaxID=222 RepID=A0A1D8I4T9_9BURK|nr:MULTISPECIES: branched-chain amino acid ABC transporter permease [Achromobacter]ALX82403.1 ABC transporter permease [Achromobacter denitrificans]MBQ2649121.1 branched-chain amino acid ABC transporter permease [Achromobacter sp.]AKP88274.1 High-affinity branched-chain amino acid transport system permease protein LivH [Achromobacter xylosoxidans]AMG43642.1 branched-chain amino acid ABC transporter permease [Achromobacter xylosoxidans]AOU91465.1 high-affinity branched-chain amino acid transpor
MFDISLPALLAQLLVGLINGCFYAILSMGLAIIFGLLNIVNFTHGAQFMMAAFLAWIGFTQLPQLLGPGAQINFWAALVLAPLIVGAVGVVIEKTLLKRLYHLDHLYGLLLTFGIALMMEGGFRYFYGISGVGYEPPEILQGGFDLGFMFLPAYRAFVVVASLLLCLLTWYLFERTRLGALLRAGTENARLLQAFGVNVPVMITLTYGFGVALAGVAGVLAAPVMQINPLMGSNLLNIVFAVVVIGGLGSIMGAIVTGLALGLLEGLAKVFYPEASTVVVFIVMAVVLLTRPAGLFGKEK